MMTKEKIDEYFNNTPPEVIKAAWEKAKEKYPDNVAGITVSQLIDAQEYWQRIQTIVNAINQKLKEIEELKDKLKEL